jgi:hypothetical protein
MLHSEEVSSPKTIKITQYLSTRHCLVDNRYFIIKSSQTTQLYITKVFDTQFSCHDKPFMMNVILNRENKPSDVSCGILFYCLIKFNQTILILSRFVTINIFSYVIMTTELKTSYIFSLFLVTIQSVQTVNGCHQII